MAHTCSVCKNETYDPKDGKAARKRHCDSPTCTWCDACFQAKKKECERGS